MNDQSALENLIGLTLDDARATLIADETLRDLPLNIVETAPPSRPAPRPMAQKKRRASSRAPQPPPNFGELRVLRAQCENDALELLVARETLRAEETSELSENR